MALISTDIKAIIHNVGVLIAKAINLRGILESTHKALRAINNYIAKLPRSVVLILLAAGLILAITGPIIVALSVMITMLATIAGALANIIAAWSSILALASATATIIGSIAASVAWPLAIAAAVIAVIVAIFATWIYLTKGELSFLGRIGQVLDTIVNKLGKILDFTSRFMGHFKENMGILFRWFLDQWDNLISDTIQLSAALITFLTENIIVLSQKLVIVFTVFFSWLVDNWKIVLVKMAMAMITVFADIAVGIWNIFKRLIIAIKDGLVRGFTDGAFDLTKVIGEFGSGLWDAFFSNSGTLDERLKRALSKGPNLVGFEFDPKTTGPNFNLGRDDRPSTFDAISEMSNETVAAATKGSVEAYSLFLAAEKQQIQILDDIAEQARRTANNTQAFNNFVPVEIP